MHNEIEAQFIEIDKYTLREQLRKLNAKLIQPEVLMRRTIFGLGPRQFARVRDEGSKITMTYKHVMNDNSITGTKEINLTIDKYDYGVAFLKACGLRIQAKQETLREIWSYEDVEICLDTWPWIPPYVEIEGTNPDLVWEVAEKLGFDKSDAFFGSVDTKYHHYYGIDRETVNQSTPIITFDCPPPDWVDPIKLQKILHPER